MSLTELQSMMPTMLGCDSMAAVRASRWKRSSAPSSFEGFRADDLHGDDAMEPLLAGLENAAHAALTEQVEDNVLIEDQFLSLAVGDLADLKGGQPAAADQFLTNRCRVAGLLGAG